MAATATAATPGPSSPGRATGAGHSTTTATSQHPVQLLVYLRRGTSPRVRAATFRRARVVRARSLPGAQAWLVRPAAGRTAAQAATALRSAPQVLLVRTAPPVTQTSPAQKLAPGAPATAAPVAAPVPVPSSSAAPAAAPAAAVPAAPQTPTGPVPPAPARGPLNLPYVPGEVIIGLKPQIAEAALGTIARTHSLGLARHLLLRRAATTSRRSRTTRSSGRSGG